MRWMGEYLNRQGLTCLGIRLNGHGTDPEDMRRSRWTDWTASVEDGFHLLSGSVDRIHLVGLSMGGALSLLMSTRLEISGVVAMSTPCQLPQDYPLWAMKVYSLFVRDAQKSKEPPGSSWVDKEAYASHISYPRNPTLSAIQLKLLLNEMNAALPGVRKPVLLIHSRDDQYVLPGNMERIHAGLVNAPERTKLYVTGSGHVVTRDAARQQVFDAALDFIRRLEPS